MRQYTVFQTDNPVIYANYDITDSTIDSVHSEELPINRTRQTVTNNSYKGQHSHLK